MPFASVFLQRFLHSKCLSHRCRRFFVCLQFLVFATSGILGICSAFLPSGSEHIVVYGVWWVWTGGGCWGDSSVIELRWKDLIRLGRGGVGEEDSSVIKLRWKDLIRLGRGGVGAGDSSIIELRWKDLTNIRSLSRFLAFAFLRHRPSQTHIDIYT